MEILINNILDDVSLSMKLIESKPLDVAFLLGCIFTKLQVIKESQQKN